MNIFYVQSINICYIDRRKGMRIRTEEMSINEDTTNHHLIWYPVQVNIWSLCSFSVFIGNSLLDINRLSTIPSRVSVQMFFKLNKRLSEF